MAAVSPSSSPRLPSPPPIAEDQIGPTSPGVSLFEEQGGLAGSNSVDTGAARRIRPGTRAADMAEGPPLVELHEIDSAFVLTEHLKALHYHYTHPSDSNEVRPIDAELARLLTQPPANTSREIWLYELGRFLIQKTNAFLVALFADSPACSPQTCPEMRASEWQYLCAVHDPPKSCSAIDYCCHTLDWAATSLTSSKMFPSRLGLGTGNTGGQNDKFLQQQMKEITNIFRRVYRIYAHAWFQHRDMFWKVEGKTGLYIFFKTVCDAYNLIQQENYTIPREAEGADPEEATITKSDPSRPRPTSILPRPSESESLVASEQEPAGNHVQALGNTTKRHTRAPSNLTDQAQVIQEETEEEDDSAPKSRDAPSDTTQVEPVTIQKLPDEVVGEEEEQPPVPGVARSDTVKQQKPANEEETGDITVIAAGPDEAPAAEDHTETKVEVTEVPAAEDKETENPAAD